MTILVESVEDEIDHNLGNNKNPESDPKTVTLAPAIDDGGFTLPAKFKGKTLEEIAQSYVELESSTGALKNQLGDYRTITDRFLSIEEKRVADLKEVDAEDYNIDPTELLSDPNKVLEKFYNDRRAKDPEFQALTQRLDAMEAQVGQSSLQQAHPDAVELINDPRFQAWVGEDPYRQQIANQAVQNKDVPALTFLLKEWKERNPTSVVTDDPHARTEVQTARSVSTESSTSGTSAATSGKRFSRRKLVQLKMQNPDEYSAMSEEILLAYAQKRVDD